MPPGACLADLIEPIAHQLTGQFNVYAFTTSGVHEMPYTRRDFYKISLYTSGSTQVQYAGRTLTIDQPALVFYNPLLPYACHVKTCLDGYYCLFTESFLMGATRDSSLQESPLFRIGAEPVFFLTSEQARSLTHLFEQMTSELDSGYRYKYELIRTYVQQVVHLAQRMQDNRIDVNPSDAAVRLFERFNRLVEHQFPIQSPTQPLRLRTAQDYAEQLSIHVNYLNRLVRQLTGRTTTAYLNARITQEAKALLRHTDWSIKMITDSLGFARSTNFTHFFRQQTGVSPRSFRQNK